MKAPSRLRELFSFWGEGLARYRIVRKDLIAKRLDKAHAEVAYT